MVVLTKRVVDAVQPGERDQFIWDAKLKGFGLRVRPSGRKFYVAQRKRDGRTVRVMLGEHGRDLTCEEARTKAEAELPRLLDVATERDARKADLNVADLCDRWLAAGCPRAKPGRDGRAALKSGTADIYRSAIVRHIKPLLGSRKLATLGRTDIARFQSDVAAGRTATDEKTKARGRARVTGGAGIAGRVTAYLAAILSWAVRYGLLTVNPATGVDIIPSGRRERYLSAGELGQLGEALAAAERDGANPAFVAGSRLLALTGCRRNEVMRLRWSEVDLEAGLLRLADSKTGAKLVPLSAAARAVLAAVPRIEGSPWVFPASRGEGPARGLNRFWRTLRKRAGLAEDVTPHTLRHTLASTAIANGASLFLTGKVLGHANARTTERYAHHALDPVAAVMEAASQRVADSMRTSASEPKRR
jgi:integrase